MVDTLRADKMHVYNPKTRVQTPNYDAFAADATRFEWAQVPGTWSLPSHASLLTGVYPSVHKAVAHEARLSKDVHFIAEEMKKAGFETGMFSSNGYVSAQVGLRSRLGRQPQLHPREPAQRRRLHLEDRQGLGPAATSASPTSSTSPPSSRTSSTTRPRSSS